MSKYAPLLLKKIAIMIVGDGTENRLNGKDLVDFFNYFGFNDDYVYSNGGITTVDIGNGLSRTDYTRKRLKILNDKNRIDEVLSTYIDSCPDRHSAEETIHSIIGKAPEIKEIVDTITFDSFQPKSQFDEIPSNVPIVFISYSWDDEEHKKWVKKLSDALREKYSVYTLLDRYNCGGISLVEFMDRGLRIAHRVLMIGTPSYKQKSETGYGTGGKYEGSIINAEIYQNTNTLKFIPLLRRGESFKESFISIIAVRNGYDFRDDSRYEETLRELADDIYGRGNKAPKLGSMASSIDGSNAVAPIEYKGERWLYELLKYFSFYLMDDYLERMPYRFDMRVLTMFDAWDGIINSSVYHIDDIELRLCINDFFLLWKEICDLGWRFYSDSDNGKDYVFYGTEFDFFKNREQEEAFEQITNKIIALHSKFKRFVSYLDAHYPQIDREKISIDFVTRMKMIKGRIED